MPGPGLKKRHPASGHARRSHGAQRPIDVHEAWVRMPIDKRERNYRVNVACVDWSIRVERVTPQTSVDEPEYYNVTVRCREKRPAWAIDARITVHLRNFALPDDTTQCYRDFEVFRFHSTKPMCLYQQIMTVDDIQQPTHKGLQLVKDGSFELVVIITVTRLHVSHYAKPSFKDGQLQGADKVAICSDEKRVKFHKEYLMIYSAYFKGMYSSNLAESRKEVANLPNISGRSFTDVLRAIYPIRTPIEPRRFHEMCIHADYFAMPALMTMCENFLISDKCTLELGDKFRLAYMHRYYNAEAALLRRTQNRNDITSVFAYVDNATTAGAGQPINSLVLDVLRRRASRFDTVRNRRYAVEARIEIALAKRVDAAVQGKQLDAAYLKNNMVTAVDIQNYREVLVRKFGEDVVRMFPIEPNISVDVKKLKFEARKRRREITIMMKLARRRHIRQKKAAARKRQMAEAAAAAAENPPGAADQTARPQPKMRGFKEKRQRKSKKKAGDGGILKKNKAAAGDIGVSQDGAAEAMDLDVSQ